MPRGREQGMMSDSGEREPSFVQLRVFHATMITGSVTRAAKLLGITQPAASKMLRMLEAETGLVLFTRENQRLLPTQQAEQLQESVVRLYGSYGAVQRLIGSLRSSDRGNVTVAAIPTQSTNFLPRAIKVLRKKHPLTRVAVDILPNQEVIQRVQSGKADFGLVFNITPSPDTLNEDMGHHHLVCVAPQGHRFAAMPYVTAEDLRHETFISFGQYTSFGLFLRMLLADDNVYPDVDVVVTSSALLITLVREGIGVGLVESPAILPSSKCDLVVKAFRPMAAIRSRIIRSRIKPLSVHAELLLDVCRRAAHDVSGDVPPLI